MNFRKGKGREELEINLIPFIDVLLVILIFMMVTTTYSKFTALKITLPTADAEKAVDLPFQIDVMVNAQGQYSINNIVMSATTADSLADEMKKVVSEKGESNIDPVVSIHADALSTHQSVINVLEAARLAGFDKVTFAAESGDKK